MATTKSKKTRKPVDLAEAFGNALDEAVQIDERYHLECLLEEARNLTAALELELAGTPAECDQDEWPWVFRQLEMVNKSLLSRNNALRELRYSQAPDCDSDVIPF